MAVRPGTGDTTIQRRIQATASKWLAAGVRTVASTLIDADGSAPFEVGATMLVDEAGRIEGSVTGGCVEGALFEEAQSVLAGGGPRVRTYGVSDDQAVSVGLTCGGTVHVFVRELPPPSAEVLQRAATAIGHGRDVAVMSVVEGAQVGATAALVDGELLGTLGQGERLDETVARDARGAVDHASSMLRRYGSSGDIMGRETAVFIEPFSTPPKLIIFGAIDYAIAVAALGKQLGYHVTICDARQAFAASERLGVADEVAVSWPDEHLRDQRLTRRDVVLVFTHDPKFDEPALRSALATDAGYIGALGSRRTHRDRVERLLAAGVPQAAIDRIAAPCGLDIGARTPEETAVSILAEVIASGSGRQGPSLSTTTGSIRPPRVPSPTTVPGRPETVADMEAMLAAGGYLADRGVASSLLLAQKLSRPLLLEGEPGVGKTELAKAYAAATGARLIRLQCYEGIDVHQALYDWNFARQMLFIRALDADPSAREDAVRHVFGEEFLLRRPLLEALQSDEDVVLLIDEIDRADDEFEAFLLELLSDYQVSIPEIGTVRATRTPLVVLTSNRTRELHDALRRRCLYHWVAAPDRERELRILGLKAREASEQLAEQVCTAVQAIRALGPQKPPGIGETIDWATALAMLGVQRLDDEAIEATLGTLVKHRADQELVLAELLPLEPPADPLPSPSPSSGA
ncbi:hypothetical protein DSM104299_03677 [Baekduia alba]|uniref:XdhC family protein n=1 Tax=Baekduia alba TaxID=2997333 RepID=UPI002342481F|nr:XdhC family protein [Baekduia alba]WCB94937.1 hypothetical protein DSM104299_03677 [Baekduia alba]